MPNYIQNSKHFILQDMNHSVSTLTGKTKIKIVFLGNTSVGKSSVIQQYIHNKFQQTAHPTVGIDFLAKNVIHKSKTFRLQLWDTAGQERFRSLIPSYLKDSQCALILFDVTNRQSFDVVEDWLRMYNENKTGGMTILIGNKIDLDRDRQVSVEQGMKKAEQLKIFYFEISAKTSENIDSLFINLIDICTSTLKFNPSDFIFKKQAEQNKIEEEDEKNQEEKQKQTKPTVQSILDNQKPEDFTKKDTQPLKQKQINQKRKQTQSPGKAEAEKENKVIRLQQKKQKQLKNNKNCC